MLSKEQKKEAISQFKERKVRLGIYAVRCPVSGQAWAGASRNLDAAKNSIWMSLRMGAHRDKALQQEWNARSEGAFAYEVLETLEEDVAALLVPDMLKAAKRRWMLELEAAGLL